MGRAVNLRALKCCVEIARLGSFTRAAEAMHIAQPALSMAVTRLEEELGVVLFNRAARQISVTAEGQVFLERVAKALLELDMAHQELGDMADLQRGEIRLGVPPMFGIHYMPELLSAFRQAYPGIVMSVFEGSADEIGRLLEARQIDLALLESRRVGSAWESVLLGTDEMVLCMNQQHPLAGEARLEAARLQDADMVVFDQSFLQRHLLDAFCAEGGVTYRIALQSNFVSLVTRATFDGLGISTLLRSVQQGEPGIVGVPFEPALNLSFRLCWRANEYLSLANRRFVECAQHAGFSGRAAG
ncbi:DNA-binding transcriptional regulator, LysR family [Pseudomonas flavescens]|uniref:DNA-binding transcriptional regulator, LysR family n=1 Tax=Phytopseudomonas flavescens TaxID=29435 RepID=A0A1G7X7D1_9GAMM|nr:DNA-binding transcriptional regulator, LysR family [Pseudomonas flavescens]